MEFLRGLQDSDIARRDPLLFNKGYIPEYNPEVAFVSAYSLNMRIGPNFDLRSFRQLSRGEKVIILDSVGFGWVEVRSAR